MNYKKVLAMATVATMTLGSSMTAFASSPTAVTTASTFTTASTTSGGELKVVGDVNYVNDKIYSIILPTSNSMKFYLDPQGLLQMTSDKASLDDLAEHTGKIVGVAAAGIVNKSSVPIDMEVKMTPSLTIGGSAATGDNKLVETQSAAQEPTDNAAITACLLAVPSAQNAYSSADNIVANYKEGALGIPLTQETKIKFRLDEAKYLVTRTGTEGSYTYDYGIDETITNNGSGQAIAFSGWLNPAADYSEFDEDSTKSSLTVDVVFTYTSTLTANETIENGKAYGWLKTSNTDLNDKAVMLHPYVSNVSATTFKAGANTGDITITYTKGDAKQLSKVLVDVGGTIFDLMAEGMTDYGTNTFGTSTTGTFVAKPALFNLFKAGDTVGLYFVFDDDTAKNVPDVIVTITE